MPVDLALADDQLGAVAEPLLTLVGGGQVALLHRRAEGDVADRVVGVRRGSVSQTSTLATMSSLIAGWK